MLGEHAIGQQFWNRGGKHSGGAVVPPKLMEVMSYQEKYPTVGGPVLLVKQVDGTDSWGVRPDGTYVHKTRPDYDAFDLVLEYEEPPY